MSTPTPGPRPGRRAMLTAAAVASAGYAVQPAAAAGPPPQPDAPDLILRKGRITTMDPAQPEAEAVAVTGDRIVAIGNDHEVMRLRGRRTRVIDLHRHRVIPGLNDSHIHLVNGAVSYNLEVRWDGLDSLAEALALLRAQAERTPPGEWVRVVGGWSEFQFAERRMPTLAEVNAVAPETPVFVMHLYVRGLLNAAALRSLGYDRFTPDPPGGQIVRDAQGNPTGLLIAEPGFRVLFNVLSAAPALSPSQQVNSTRQFLRELNRLGITSLSEGAAINPTDIAPLLDVHRAGQLTVRTSLHLYSPRPGAELADISEWVRTIPRGGDDYLRVNGIGEILTYSAFDTGNFFQPPPTLAATAEQDLLPVIRLLAENGWPFRIHATYDGSISRILPVLEQVNREIPLGGLRWILDHAETISPGNVARVAALGGGISVQDRLAFQGEYFAERFGAEAAYAQPLERINSYGIPLGLGTDATRLASYNPWVALQWFVTGRTLGGLPVIGAGGRLSREAALRHYTIGSAWFSHEEDRKGTLAPGMLADLAVLSEDYFAVPVEKIATIASVLTLTGGEIVHAGGRFRRLDPPHLPVDPVWSPVA